jgi:polyferredoxin
VLVAGMVVAALLPDAPGMDMSGTGWDVAMPGGGSTVAAVAVSVVLLVVTGLVPRFFCRYLCPFGAVLAVAALPRRARIAKPRGGCGPRCRLCAVACPMQIDLNAVDQVRDPECVQCLRCVDACPPRGTARLVLTTPRVNR